MPPETTTCPYASDHPAMAQRLTTVEREIAELRRRQESDVKDWQAFLISFGELKSKVADLNGRVGGYLLAGSLLAAVVAVIAQRVMGG